MSAYRAAIDETTKAIDHRARYYRNLIVAVSAISLGSIGWAVVSWSFSPLVGVVLLVPACGLFFFLDGRLLDDWRSGLIAAWANKDLDFQAFRHAAGAMPALPKGTLQSMLATLPRAKDLVAEQDISSSTREGVAAAVAAVQACQSDTVAVKAATSGFVSTLMVVAVVSRTWKPLLGFLALLLLPLVRGWLKRRRIAIWQQRILTSRAKPDFSGKNYRQLVTCPPWDEIPGEDMV